MLEAVSPARGSRRVTDVKRAAETLMLMLMLAAVASAAVVAPTREGEGRKTQWAPTRNFSGLNARAVFASESGRAASPYAGETGTTAAGSGEARYYDSNLGVFLSRDSFEGVLTEAPSLHRYTYAHNSPVEYTDPSGRVIPILVGLGIVVGLGVAVAHDEPGGSVGLQAMAMPPLAAVAGVGEYLQGARQERELLAQGNLGPSAEKQLQEAQWKKTDGLILGVGGALGTGAMVKPSPRTASNISRLESTEPSLTNRPMAGSAVRPAPDALNRQMSRAADYYQETYGVEAPGGPTAELEAGGPRPPFQPTGQRVPRASNPFFPSDAYSPESVRRRQQENRTHYVDSPVEQGGGGPRAASNPSVGRLDSEHEGTTGFDRAREAAAARAGETGPVPQQMHDPETGTLIGEMSPNGKQGWRTDNDHFNWWNWSQGKKGHGGAYGHEFFPGSQAGPHSKHIGYAPWQPSALNPPGPQ